MALATVTPSIEVSYDTRDRLIDVFVAEGWGSAMMTKGVTYPW